jgi:hypothetical protein
MLPSLIDYVNVGPNNWLWGKMLYSTMVGLNSRPMAQELTKGVPCFLLLTFLASLIYFIRKIIHYRLAKTQQGSYKIVVDGKEANDDEKLILLAASLGVAVLLAWLLMLKIHNYSLWWLVVRLIPGAGCIRAVYRFQHVLAFPLAIVIAIGVHLFIKYVTGHSHSYVKRSVYFIALGFFGLLLLGEQFNTGSLANYSKQQQLNMLANISHPPLQAKVFALLPDEGLKKSPFEAQIDAMIIAQKYGLCTINGYSGQFPPGWSMVYDFDKPEYIFALGRWIQRYNLENDQLYFLDIKTGSWLVTKTLHERGRFILMKGPLEDTNFALKLSAENIPSQWQKNEMRQCTIRIKNNGNIALSSVGSDFNDTGKYAIRLSYRWVENGSSVQSLDGFDNRSALPEGIKPNSEITMNLDIKAPSNPGEYWLEIEAVQELVAWFKDKGCSGIRMEEEVK